MVLRRLAIILFIGILFCTFTVCFRKKTVVLSSEISPDWHMSVQDYEILKEVSILSPLPPDPEPNQDTNTINKKNIKKAPPQYKWFVVRLQLNSPFDDCRVKLNDIMLVEGNNIYTPLSIDMRSEDYVFSLNDSYLSFGDPETGLLFGISGKNLYFTTAGIKNISFLYKIPNDARDLTLKFPDPQEKNDILWIDNTKTPFDVSPIPIGGTVQLYKALIYPEAARKAGIEGHVVVKVNIDKDGEILNAFVSHSLDSACDEAALNAVKSVKWNPAQKDGNAITAWYKIPIFFRLQ